MTEPTAAGTPDQDVRVTDADERAAPISATGGNRLLSLDFTRGIAVMGILAANIVAFGQPMIAYMWPDGFLTPHGAASDQLWVAQFVLIDGKMRGLFTLLFGAGMILFLDKAWERGQGRGLQFRRLLWLLAFGLIHFFFIWRGDILTLYAMCGIFCLLFVKWRPKTQLGVGITFYLVGAGLFSAISGFFYWVMEAGGAKAMASQGAQTGGPSTPAEVRGEFATMKTQGLDTAQAETPLIQSGDYFGWVHYNLTEHWAEPLSGILIFGFETIPLILIGMALYRFGLFDGRLSAKKQAIWGAMGVAVGLAGSLAIGLWTLERDLSFYATFLSFVGTSTFVRLPFVIGLAALLALIGPKATGWLGSRVSAAGRMAFSNYLGTSILMLLVFHGFALGLYGELTRPQLYIVVGVTWIIMLAWSKAWLTVFRFGPLEWLWRCLTYGKLFAIRRERGA
ncbi:DUF418 domain-containing protein [Alteriqipengyuania lutimaris]|uniref:DUF418 domain-containing protein n=1 Tax=Alteriqipengyuania lutimaris TaxID=1538146 RepID=A0A395LNF4_9SPHN|nr:DUF418 domain-containing protein [Alteriqipengyuania lutimaris]MBB3033523.1 uncharacterized protein [Alteriqipengyuania lutimaris]RDS78596.1 DUF418 domain-containing protein [Alteriqipengyuania lutimaris]